MGTVRIPRLAVFLASFALASIVSGAEIPVDLPIPGPAPRSQWNAAVAAGGDQYLVLWNDERTEAQQKHAMRLSGDGTALDPNGIRVKSRFQSPGHVVWAGNGWFVVSEGGWDEELGRVAGPELTLIDRNGKVVGPAPRTLPIEPQSGISVAADGRHVIIGYDREGSNEKRALVLDNDGETIADLRLSEAGVASASGPPAIGSNGSVFVALWVSGAAGSNGAQTIEGVRFDSNGTRGPARPVFGSFSRSTPAMASDGRDFMVIQDQNVYRMTADLEVGFLFGSPFESAQSIVWTGSAYALVLGQTSDSRAVKIVRLDRDGHLLGQQSLRLDGNAAGISRRAAASNGETLILAWHDVTEEKPTTVETFTDTYAATVSLSDLSLGPRKLLSVSAARQYVPATASGGAYHVTVWQEATGLYARRHWRNGSADGPPIRLSAEASSAAVVFNGTDFIVASPEGSTVVIRRLPANGSLRVDGESRIDGGSAPRHVALATSGGVTLVAWFDNSGYNSNGGTVYAARAGADGAFLDTKPLALAPAELASTVQTIAVSPNDDGEFLVVWGGTNPFCPCSPIMLASSDTLRAARVTSSLAVLDNPAIEVVMAVSPYSSKGWPYDALYDPQHSLYVDHPSVAWNGTEWLVVWNRAFRVAIVGGEPEGEEIAVLEEIRGRRIGRNGTLLDGPARDPGILLASGAFAPSVAWTGSGYRLAWYEGLPNHRDRLDILRYPLLRIRTASFDAIGGPLSDVRTIGESKWADPVSFSVADGVASSAYARIADEPQYGGVSRAFLDVPTSGSRRRAVRP
jgi:hypothetical protein